MAEYLEQRMGRYLRITAFVVAATFLVGLWLTVVLAVLKFSLTYLGAI